MREYDENECFHCYSPNEGNNKKLFNTAFYLKIFYLGWQRQVFFCEVCWKHRVNRMFLAAERASPRDIEYIQYNDKKYKPTQELVDYLIWEC